MSDDELELLAPWNEIVKAEIERRANESNQSYLKIKRLTYIQIGSEVVAKEYPDKVMHLRKLQV